MGNLVRALVLKGILKKTNNKENCRKNSKCGTNYVGITNCPYGHLPSSDGWWCHVMLLKGVPPAILDVASPFTLSFAIIRRLKAGYFWFWGDLGRGWGCESGPDFPKPLHYQSTGKR